MIRCEYLTAGVISQDATTASLVLEYSLLNTSESYSTMTTEAFKIEPILFTGLSPSTLSDSFEYLRSEHGIALFKRTNTTPGVIRLAYCVFDQFVTMVEPVSTVIENY